MNKSAGTYFQTAKKRLLTAGLKITPQRLAIYGALMQLNIHPRAEQIYEWVKADNPAISLGTVYKTLETFVSNGLISRVLTTDGLMRYDAHLEPHSHVYCTDTDEIFDFTDPRLHQLLEVYFQQKNIHNLKITGFHLQISAEKIYPDKLTP